jgi:hypothetical protein
MLGRAKADLQVRREKALNTPGTLDHEMFTGSGQGQYVRAVLRQAYVGCMESRGYNQVRD